MKRIVALVICTFALNFAKADFVAPTVVMPGWDRPTASNVDATFQAWETFTSASATGINSPQLVKGIGTGDPVIVTHAPPDSNTFGFGGPAGSVWSPVNSTTANLVDMSGAAFVTGGGNLYSPTGFVTPRITIPNNLDATIGNNGTGTTTILLQIRLQGSDLAPGTLLLDNPVDGPAIAPTSITSLATMPLGGFGGTLRDYAVQFDVPGNADLYTINFSAAASSMSLDRVAVDTYWNTTVVPEPGLLAIITLGAIAVRRRVGACRAG